MEPSPLMRPESVDQRYRSGLPLGEIARAFNRTCGCWSPTAQVLTTVESAVRLRLSGTKVVSISFGFWANACEANSCRATRAIGSINPTRLRWLLNISAPCVRSLFNVDTSGKLAEAGCPQ